MTDQRPRQDDAPRLAGRKMVGCILLFWVVVFAAITWFALRDVLKVF